MANVQAFNRVEAAVVTIPAATTAANPLSTDVSFNPGTVVGLEIKIPPGHAGLTGLAIAQAHQAVIPAGAGDWLIGDDDDIEWALQGYSNTGSFQAIGYNLDVFAHSFYLRFLVSDAAAGGASGSSAVAPLDLGAG